MQHKPRVCIVTKLQRYEEPDWTSRRKIDYSLGKKKKKILNNWHITAWNVIVLSHFQLPERLWENENLD